MKGRPTGTAPNGVGVAVRGRGVAVLVTLRVGVGVREGVRVTVFAQLDCLGVPHIALGAVVQVTTKIVQPFGVPASSPFLITPVLVAHEAGPS